MENVESCILDVEEDFGVSFIDETILVAEAQSGHLATEYLAVIPNWDV